MTLRFPFAGALGPEVYLPGPGLATHLIPIALWGTGLCHQGVSLLAGFGALTPNEDQIAMNFALAAVLLTALAVWTFLRARQRLSAATGAGLVLAGHALAARTWIELGAFHGGEALDLDQAGPLLGFVVFGGRWLALAGFGLGLGAAAAAVVAERRLARRLQAWAARV